MATEKLNGVSVHAKCEGCGMITDFCIPGTEDKDVVKRTVELVHYNQLLNNPSCYICPEMPDYSYLIVSRFNDGSKD